MDLIDQPPVEKTQRLPESQSTQRLPPDAEKTQQIPKFDPGWKPG